MRKHLMHRKAGSVTLRKPSVTAPAPASKMSPKSRHCMSNCVGWLMGLEPTTTGITILDSTN